MSKAILIMDMPKCCSDCHYCNNKNYKNPSCALTNYADGFQSMTLENIHNARQSWCPLVPMPEERNVVFDDQSMWAHQRRGWNACIDAILEKTNNSFRE